MTTSLVAVGCPTRGILPLEGIETIIGPHDLTWLSPGRAALLESERPLDQAAIQVARNHAHASEFDLFVTTGPLEKKKVLVADMEATIILDEMLDLLAEKLGLGPVVARITSRAMNGEIDFSQSLSDRTALFAGAPQSELVKLCAQIRFAPGAECLVRTMKDAGARTVLVTGGYEIFAEKVQEVCGFDEVVANKPVIRGGVLTGDLISPICIAHTKRDVLEQVCGSLGLSPRSACAIGDGANDIEMLKIAGLATSYHGKPILHDVVDFNIVHGDLEAVLFAQGYRESEFSKRG